MANSVKAPGCSVEPAAGSGRSDSYFRTELGGFLEGPAGSLLQRHAEGLIIVLRDDGRFQQDLVDDGLIAQRSDRHHGAEAALREASIVAAGEQLAGFDGVDRFLGAVDADHPRFLLRIVGLFLARLSATAAADTAIIRLTASFA